jgi:hypothetical protein
MVGLQSKHLRSEIEITAAKQTIWNVLIDFAAYSTWNPFVRSISGNLAPGTRLNVTVEPQGSRPMSFKPRLLVFEPLKELRWKGQLLMPGLFDGEHYFQLVEVSEGTVRFVQGEIFTGLLVPLTLRGSMLAGTERGFAAMNRALKARAEAD